MNTNEQHVYYGSLTQKVYLQKANAQIYNYEQQKDKVYFQQCNKSISQSLQYRFPQKQLGKNYQKLLIPCVSAQQLKQFVKPENENNQGGILYQPLIKTNIKQNSVQGFQSGRRSCLILDEQNKQYYRLKGCGNLGDNRVEEGFPILECQSKDEGTHEIRGAQFEHTAFRELYMNQQIQNVMELHNIQMANYSVGCWKYNNQFIQNFQDNQDLQNQYQLIDKFCGVYKNFGEKRVMTHLIQGINILLLGILQQCHNDLNLNDILNLFPKDRLLQKLNCDNNETYHYPEKTPVILDFKTVEEIQNQGGIKELLQTHNIFQNEDFQQYVNLHKFLNYKKNNSQNSGKNLQGQKVDWRQLKQFYKDHQIINNSEYVDLFDKISENMDQCDFDQILENISYIYGRVGFEIGKIFKIMMENSINWGYYRDHHPYTFHCNAHPNNFVVLDQQLKSNNLIAPLDYDLAFFEEQFININYDDEKYAQFDKPLFDSYQNQSRVALELALSGIEMYSNFSFDSIDMNKFDHGIIHAFETLHIANRDTMMIHYMNNFMNLNESQKKPEQTIEMHENYIVHDIIKLSLILTSDLEC